MLEVRVLDDHDKAEYEKIVQHPIQSWKWGEFKKYFNCEVERIGVFENGTMIDALQIVFSKVPKLGLTVGYAGKVSLRYRQIFPLLEELAKKHHAIFIKTEANVFRRVNTETGEAENNDAFTQSQKFLLENGARSGKALFTHYDFHLNLSPSEDELMQSFHSKTRYNTRLAERKGVQVVENRSLEGMKNYVRLMQETTARQGFYNHNEAYFLKLLEYFPEENMTILEAHYEEKILTAWILFRFNGKLYYPYGASSNENRNVMPNNLVMWTAIQYGKKHRCSDFDLWGCLGPHPDEHDSWYGFHKFKSGYNPQLVEYVGTYDFVYKPFWYKLFNIANKLRWRFLKHKKIAR